MNILGSIIAVIGIAAVIGGILAAITIKARK
jgi:hypothetical protein